MSVSRITLSSLFGLVCFASACVNGPAEAEGQTEVSALESDVYNTIYDSIQDHEVVQLLKDMSGVNPVTVGAETFSITDRYKPASKDRYRKYWTTYFQGLGMTVNPMAFATQSGLEPQGHNLEAILPGKVTDSVVVIVHYDSMGPHGSDNPAADDDMTGMATLMETARALAPYRGRIHNTIRFVAADYEEWGSLEGSREYAKYIKGLAQQQGFHILAAIDDEQSGWKEGANTLDIFDRGCSGSTPDSSSLSHLLVDTTTRFTALSTHTACIGANSDNYAMWEVGVPAVVFGEHDPFNNPHFDEEGGDTFDKINQAYFTQIARVGVTFAARVAVIDP